MTTKDKQASGEKRVLRKTTDKNFEHCAVTLLPFCADIAHNLTPGEKIEADWITCLRILAEVAEAFSVEKYGKKYQTANQIRRAAMKAGRP